MTAFFDTSVLLAAFSADHEHHEPSLRVFARATKETGCCAVHSLAELYSVTTRMPLPYRLSATEALPLLQNVRKRLTLVQLDADQYLQSLQDAAYRGIVGGATYDALLLACALKAQARTIYTWNVAHFRRALPAAADRIHVPT